MSKDNVFENKMTPFAFNQQVVNVFEDMVSRSVPMYHQLLDQIAQLTSFYYNNDAIIYDVGCSLGGLIPALKQRCASFRYHGIDASQDMIEKAQAKFSTDGIQFECANARSIHDYPNAGIIVCNLTLQFMPVSDRVTLMTRFMHALQKNGACILVEKIQQEDVTLQDVYNQSFYEFKKDNGYSQTEILNKEAALKGVLQSQSDTFYSDAWNRMPCIWSRFFQWYNFVGYIGIKT